MNNNELTSEIKFNYVPINSDSVKDINKDINNPLFFGIFDIHVNQSPVTTIQQTINIAIDGSASMSENCNDGKEKIQHIKHIVKNILNYILTIPEVKVILNVFVFDSKITDILINETVTQENIEELKKKIDKINAWGGTNIEIALKKFIELSNDNNSGVVSNIFMSDGYANEGVTNSKKLTGLVNESVSNTFIGFGIEHNPKLLSDLSSGNNASYFYIDILENAGHVYGEILHGILYKRFKNTILTIENGLVYNWKTNSWSTSLLIGDLISDTCKQYHIISHNCDVVKCSLVGDDILSDLYMNKQFCFDNFYDDLTKYFFRQKTLQMLFNSRHLNNDDNDNNGNNDNNDNNGNYFCAYNLDTLTLNSQEDEEENIKKENIRKEKNENIKLFKKQMKNLIKEMEDYVKKYDIVEDKFIKNLCLDIAICYKTLGTNLGQMYSCSRQTSQGTQRVHSVRTPRKNQYSLTPCSKNKINLDDDDDDDDSIFTRLQSPRKKKNNKNKINSFDSLDHLLNDEDEDEYEDEVIDKYINDDNNNDITLKLDIDTPYYCSNTLMTTIRSINEKNDDINDDINDN
jgi:hypothetical protein